MYQQLSIKELLQQNKKETYSSVLIRRSQSNPCSDYRTIEEIVIEITVG